MRFEEQTRQTRGHAGQRQIQHLRAAAAGCRRAAVALLQRVGNIKNNRQMVAGFLHHAETQHIHHQIVVAELAAAFAQNHLLVAGFGEFLNDILHLGGT